MNERVRQVLDEARRLTVAEQLDLARLLLEGEAPDCTIEATSVDAAWDAEAVGRPMTPSR